MSVPDVVDVLGEVIRQQYSVLQFWINKIPPEYLELLGSTGIYRTNELYFGELSKYFGTP